MRRELGAALLLLTACGRINFDPLDETGTQTRDNVVFVSATQVVPGSLGDLAAADAVCDADAVDAGLTGRYVAWLSTSSVDAIERLSGARGWRLPDGSPFADTPEDIAAGRIFFPPKLLPSQQATFALVVTGSTGTGRYAGTSCNDLRDASSGMIAGTGNPWGTTGQFSSAAGLTPTYQRTCGEMSPIYCFGVDGNLEVPPPLPETGKLLFVAPGFRPGGGIASADAWCAQAATTGGRAGTFRAFLATTTTGASARFTSTSGPVVRADGVEVASMVSFLDGLLLTPANLTLDGTFLDVQVWTGSASASQPSPTSNCDSWTNATAADSGYTGRSALSDGAWFDFNTSGTFNSFLTCDTAAPLYCLEI